MRYNNVLLVNPSYSGSRVKVVFCAGLGYIAESLEHAVINYDIIDLSSGTSYEYFTSKITEMQPDLIAISMMTYRYKESYAFINTLKNDFPQIPVVIGGAHISLMRERVLYDCDDIDFGIVLEGEETLIELCQGTPIEEIKGLIHKKNDIVVYNGDRPFLKDLDQRPFPKYKKFHLDEIFNKDVNALPIVSSRGCPFGCTYCPVKYAIGRNFRARTPENIVIELKYWREKGYRRFSFADDNFTLMKERVYQLCELLKKEGLTDLLLSCDNGIRADRVDFYLLKLMREAGFYRIAFGVEAGNNKVLTALKKSETIETITERVQEACDLGYEVDLFFLVGAPTETLEDLEDSFRIALEYPIGAAYFYNIIPFPHTELYRWIKENGRFLIEPDDYLDFYPILDNIPVFETPEMPLNVRKKAFKKAFAISRITQRRSWTKRLSHLRILAPWVAYIYTAPFFQNVILRNRFLNKIVYKIAKPLLKKKKSC